MYLNRHKSIHMLHRNNRDSAHEFAWKFCNNTNLTLCYRKQRDIPILHTISQFLAGCCGWYWILSHLLTINSAKFNYLTSVLMVMVLAAVMFIKAFKAWNCLAVDSKTAEVLYASSCTWLLPLVIQHTPCTSSNPTHNTFQFYNLLIICHYIFFPDFRESYARHVYDQRLRGSKRFYADFIFLWEENVCAPVFLPNYLWFRNRRWPCRKSGHVGNYVNWHVSAAEWDICLCLQVTPLYSH